MLGLSDLVEKVIATLERKDLLDTTYIFFSSDNGFHQGQHRLNSGKTTAYEEDIKLPLVVRGPHVAEGKIVDVITANVDYAPTFADIANIAIPNFVDGRSFLPYINGFRTESWRAVMLLESGGAQSINRGSKNPLFEVQDPFDIDLLDNAKYTIPAFTGLRLAKNPFNDNGPLTYIAYDTDEKELYFLDRDPYQLENSWVVADETLKTKLDAWTKLLRAAKGQALRDIEQTPP